MRLTVPRGWAAPRSRWPVPRAERPSRTSAPGRPPSYERHMPLPPRHRGGLTHMANRLAGETSPYLLQHKDNPVEWYPWGTEALKRARETDRPILLSIGYSACHWCHVMERESFEDPETAS